MLLAGEQLDIASIPVLYAVDACELGDEPAANGIAERAAAQYALAFEKRRVRRPGVAGALHRLAMVTFAGSETEDDDAFEWAPLPGRSVLAWRDLIEGLKRHWMWTSLAFQDMKIRYRGSLLGPFWVTISTFVMVVAMGLIYAHLFHATTDSYMPYLGLGLIVWQLISSLINEGCQTFMTAEAIIQQIPVPFSIHAYRVVCRNFIVFAHNLVIVPIGLIVFRPPLDWHLIETGLGCLVLAVNGVWITLFLGIFSTRFRDIAPIVANLLQVIFFLTPIFFPIDALGIYRPLAEFNPMFCAIDVIRAPLIGELVEPTSWPVLVATTVIGWGITFWLFARFRNRIAYWV
jgi:ABC-type polysaccharide/polyol phosphate export permease